MSRTLSKMNAISAAQKLNKENDILCIQGYIEMIEKENQQLKEQLNEKDKTIEKTKEYLIKNDVSVTELIKGHGLMNTKDHLLIILNGEENE